MNWLRKNKNTILLVLMSGFLVSTFIGFGLYNRSGGGAVSEVALVNGEKISYQHYFTLYNRVVNQRREKGEELSPEALNQIKQEVMQSLIQETVFSQEAKKYGIEVSDAELAQTLASYPAFQKEGKFDPQAYAQTLQFALRTTPEEFEESQRKQIAIARLRAFVMQGLKITDKELDQEFAMRRASIPAKELKEYEADREKFREKLRQEKGSQVLNRWFQQIGSNLKVEVKLDQIEKRMGS